MVPSKYACRQVFNSNWAIGTLDVKKILNVDAYSALSNPVVVSKTPLDFFGRFGIEFIKGKEIDYGYLVNDVLVGIVYRSIYANARVKRPQNNSLYSSGAVARVIEPQPSSLYAQLPRPTLQKNDLN